MENGTGTNRPYTLNHIQMKKEKLRGEKGTNIRKL